MRKLTNILFVLMVVALAAAVATPEVLAGCSPSTRASNVQRPNFDDARYLGFSNASGCSGPDYGGAGCTGFVGHWWKTDNPAVNNGSYGADEWLHGQYGANFWFFQIATGAAGTSAGCVTGCITVQVEDTATDEFFLWTGDEGIRFSNNFDFSDVDGGGFTTAAAGPSPRPRISGVARDGANQVTVNFDVLDPSPGVRSETTDCGVTGAIDNINVYSQCSEGQPALDNLGGWTLQSTLAATGGAGSFNFDCAACGTADLWVSSGVVVSGNVQFLTNPAIVECDPNLADPKRKFKQIDRDQGPGTMKPKKM